MYLIKTCKKLVIISFFIALVSFINTSFAQITGPSDNKTPPPSAIIGADRILCFGQNISISGPQDSSNVDYSVYHWYKLDASGTPQLVTNVTGKTYSETTGASGYYNYQLITENASGCSSPTSDVFKIFVLPQLNVNITSLNNSICIRTGTTVLTATPSITTGYSYNYQWTRNGINIPGAKTNTYTLTNESTPTTVTIGVNISYTLNTSCTTAKATKDILITPLATKPIITTN